MTGRTTNLRVQSRFTVSLAWFLCMWLFVLQTINLYILRFDQSYGATAMYRMLYYLNYVGAFVLAFYSKLRFGGDVHERYYRAAIGKNHLKYQIIYIAAFVCMTPIHYFAGNAMQVYGISYFTRWLSLTINKVAIVLTAYAVFNLCGEKIIENIVKLFLSMYYSLVIIALFRYGIGELLKSFLVIFGVGRNTACTLFLEVHEISFVFGLYIIYYLVTRKNNRGRNGIVFVLACFAFLFAGKRIGVAGAVVAVFFNWLINKIKRSEKIIKLWGVIVFVVCFLFVMMIYDDRLFLMLNAMGIYPMGRDLLYRYFVNNTNFSPLFLGWGWGSVSTAFEYMTTMDIGHLAGNVVALHSDVFKAYIEFGFFGFVIWLYFQTMFLPKVLLRKFGLKTAYAYCVLMTYAFVTYLTDNTEGYYQFQSMLFCMISSIAYTERKNKHTDNMVVNRSFYK